MEQLGKIADYLRGLKSSLSSSSSSAVTTATTETTIAETATPPLIPSSSSSTPAITPIPTSQPKADSPTTPAIIATATSSSPLSCDVTKMSHEADSSRNLAVLLEKKNDQEFRNNVNDIETLNKFFRILENIILWENPYNSLYTVGVYSIIFWGIIFLDIRIFAAASIIALFMVLGFKNLETLTQEENKGELVSQPKAEQIEKIGRQIKYLFRSIQQLREDQPGVFCATTCILSLTLWIIGRTVSGVFLAYILGLSILTVPALLLKLPGTVISHREWDSEVEEFLPAVTEDSLQVLKMAGESGNHSPTPLNKQSDNQNEFFNDDEFNFLMPSHDENSSDEVASELELSGEETDIGDIKFQSKHFEKSSSSEEEIDIRQEMLKKKFDQSDESDNEFVIIGNEEIADFKNL
ncbi:PREDICTED: uncharacterized protein LOC107074329 [Polistes dominula]|uniref:Uncharacterized protein LOC107074329 n=1 Tax=Polistes dominula TaxID=743375 RepID=A0ABM1JFC1_POLDO|nr:PREDICTED: uncharacterized protein LOC107074329 [Polistes dominula]